MPIRKRLAFVVLLYTSIAPIWSSSSHSSPCHYDDHGRLKHLKKCLDHIKFQAGLTSTNYWFGDRRKLACSEYVNYPPSAANCYNPETLRMYESIGSRLFRVTTFDTACLDRLRIFPQVIFFSEAGQYDACDHAFSHEHLETVHAYPGMQPAKPWQLRHIPVVTWSGLASHSYHTILIVDVGYGKIQYLAFNFPKDTAVLRDYDGPMNARDALSVTAILVFAQPKGRMVTVNVDNAYDEEALFDVNKFIEANNFHQSEPLRFAEMLKTEDKQKPQFLPASLLATIDTWLTVTFHSSLIQFSLCCKDFAYEPANIQLDPLGDCAIDPVYTREPPTITVSNYFLRSRQEEYLTDDDQKPLYSLLMIDVDPPDNLGSRTRPYLIWLVCDMNLAGQSNDIASLYSTTVLPYSKPLPIGQKSHRYYILLLEQQDAELGQIKPELFTGLECPPDHSTRCFFDVSQFAAHYSLALRGMSWMQSKEDEYSKYEYISREPYSEELCGPTEANCLPRMPTFGAVGSAQIASSSEALRQLPTVTLLTSLAWTMNRLKYATS
ncbi:phosphatidylethanolamine binding protein [Trichuris trichiura]|uniref:Phosphatidylethanolamine binding protein n=1 Tax=Trichuris trichiura TaxID=36087 RepID=A0A077Z6P2_TRITR|nr:phosphatidylethanolamine binding protein [Trichuris trichiura]